MGGFYVNQIKPCLNTLFWPQFGSANVALPSLTLIAASITPILYFSVKLRDALCISYMQKNTTRSKEAPGFKTSSRQDAANFRSENFFTVSMPSTPSNLEDHQTTSESSAHLPDHSSLSSMWSGLSPSQSTSDPVEWWETLDKLVTLDHLASQNPLPIVPCQCFPVALKVIEELHGCQQNLNSCAIDHILNVARNAITACEAFSACTQQTQCGHLLLHIAILQQAASCYDHIIESPQRLSSQNIQLRVGSFEVQMDMGGNISQAILCAEIKRATGVASNLNLILQARSAENPSSELKYQQNLIDTLCKELNQSLDKVSGRSPDRASHA